MATVGRSAAKARFPCLRSRRRYSKSAVPPVHTKSPRTFSVEILQLSLPDSFRMTILPVSRGLGGELRGSCSCRWKEDRKCPAGGDGPKRRHRTTSAGRADLPQEFDEEGKGRRIAVRR